MSSKSWYCDYTHSELLLLLTDLSLVLITYILTCLSFSGSVLCHQWDVSAVEARLTWRSMVKHQPLQVYERQLCLSCITGIYGCRWKRYQRSHDDTTKVRRERAAPLERNASPPPFHGKDWLCAVQESNIRTFPEGLLAGFLSGAVEVCRVRTFFPHL